MSKLKVSVLTAGSLALAVTGGAALAAGSLPTGTAAAGAFSIDDSGFDAGNVGATACPVGFTCTNLIGNSADMLQREVVDNGTSERFLQIIIGESADVSAGQDGSVINSFAAENQIRFDTTNNVDAKMIMDEQSQAFYTEQTMFRGANDPNGGFPQQETLQILGGNFQTFNMTVPNIPNTNATTVNVAEISITQGTNPNSAAGVFAHRVLLGGGQATDFDVSVFDGNGNNAGNITVEGGPANGGLTATYIGQRATNAANLPGDISMDFGVMVYRYWETGANSGATGYQATAPTQEIRATSALSSEEGSMFGGHGSFANNGAVDMGWDESLFGTSPN